MRKKRLLAQIKASLLLIIFLYKDKLQQLFTNTFTNNQTVIKNAKLKGWFIARKYCS
jgi:hypothetical protein